MSKKKKYTGSYKRSNKSSKTFVNILKKITPYFLVVLVGLVSFFFIFPEIISFIPGDFFISISSFSETLTLNLKDNLKILFFSKYFHISVGVLLSLSLIIKFLPYRPISSNEFFTLKKMLLPYYKKIGILVVSSAIEATSNFFPFSSQESKIHQSFTNCLFLKSREQHIALYRTGENVIIFFPIISKGWKKNKVKNQLEKEIAFVSNSVDTHYKCKIRSLTNDQVSKLILNLDRVRIKNKLDLSSKNIENIHLIDQMYNILQKEQLDDVCLVFKAHNHRKSKDNFYIDLLILSDDKTIENFVTDASGVTTKRVSQIFNKLSFMNYIFSNKRNRHSIVLDKLSSFMHIPYNYKGGFLPLKTSGMQGTSINLINNADKILLGKNVDEENLAQNITINIKDILLNIEIYGMIGRGKTRLVSSVLGQLLDNKVSSIVFDIKGEYARTFVNHPGLEIFTIGRPRPLCINIFETLDEDDVRNTLLIIEEMMVSSNQDFSPAMKNLFENALFLTHRSQKRNLKTFVENVFKASRNLQSHSNASYIQQTIDAVLNRLNFIFNPINFEVLGTSRTTLDLSVLDRGKSIILDLSQFQKRAARPSDIFLICNLILKMLYRHASAKEMTNKLRYAVILEEAINIIPNFYRSESSASIITAENNFLLGRSLGIGHITISQLWDSVSNVVHGNSATKIIFRSSEKTEQIGKAINLEEDEISKIQRLPTQHCFLFSEDTELAIEIRTIDLVNDPISYSEYQAKMMKEYGRSVFPLLYNNFIDMRTALYQKSGRQTSGRQEKSSSTKNITLTHNKLEHYIPEEKKRVLKQRSSTTTSVDQEVLDINASVDLIPENIICERLCPEKTDNRECLKYKIGANIIKTAILNQNSSREIGFLLSNEDNLYSTVKNIAEKRNMELSSFLVFCVARGLVMELSSENLITPEEAFNFLKKFVPRNQISLS
jgi:hypothetical protein